MKSIIVFISVTLAFLILVDASFVRTAEKPDGAISGGSCSQSGPDGRIGTEWKLVWSDEFNYKTGVPDPKKWTRVKKGRTGWDRYMNDTDPYLGQVEDGYLILRTIVDPEDPTKLITAGITSRDKYSFLYGKAEIRAYFDNAEGQWPSLWVLGQKGLWPSNGELDLMEHLNFDSYVYQTVHSPWTDRNSSYRPTSSTIVGVNTGSFNTYGLEWGPNELIFTVNHKKTLHYPRINNTGMPPEWQFPFVQPFYFVLSMQVNGSWAGVPVRSQYPTKMLIDFVRVYQCQ